MAPDRPLKEARGLGSFADRDRVAEPELAIAMTVV